MLINILRTVSKCFCCGAARWRAKKPIFVLQHYFATNLNYSPEFHYKDIREKARYLCAKKRGVIVFVVALRCCLYLFHISQKETFLLIPPAADPPTLALYSIRVLPPRAHNQIKIYCFQILVHSM